MKKRILTFGLVCAMTIGSMNVPVHAQTKLHDLSDMIEAYPMEISSIEVNLSDETVQIDDEIIQSNHLDDKNLDKNTLFDSKSSAEDCLQEAGYGNIEWNGKTVTADNEFSSGRLILMEGYLPNDEYGAKMASKSCSGYILQYDSPNEAYEAYNELKSQGLKVMPSVIVRMMDTSLNANASLSQIKSKYLDAWTKTVGLDKLQENEKYQQSEVVVGVIDSGVNEVFGDANERIISHENLTSESGYTDGNGHGTFVTSIILDNTAENVKVRSYKVFNSDGTGADSVMVEDALNDAYADGCDVVNMSLGFDNKDELTDANGNPIKYGIGTYYDALFKQMQANNRITIAASGNTGHSTEYCYPAHSKYVWTVGSINDSKEVEYYSNYGKIDFVSKGTDVIGITNAGKTAYGSGTSMSAPLMTAMAAQLLGEKYPMSISEEYEYIKSICEDLGSQGYDSYYGYGLPIYNEDDEEESTTGSEVPDEPSSEKPNEPDEPSSEDPDEPSSEECTHNWKVSETKPGSCITEKETMYECSLCGKSKVEKGGYDYTKHGSTKTAEVQPTCKNNGSRSFICLDCNQTISKETLPAIPHDYETSVAEGSCNSTITTYTCKNCGDSYSESTGNSTHSYKVLEARESTCKESGYTVYICVNCNNKYTINKGCDNTVHKHMRVEVTAATCNTEGITKKLCTDCGTLISSESTPKLVHEYKMEEQKPTCEKNGYRMKTCNNCGEIEYSILYKTEHNYKKLEEVQATCTADGYIYQKCENCNKESYVYLDQVPHTVIVTTQNATSKKEGYVRKECAVCKQLISEEVIPKTKDQKTVFKITLDANGGSCSKSYVMVNSGESVMLPTPTRKGYTFEGWFINGVSIEEYIITGDCTAVAQWKKSGVYNIKIDTKCPGSKITTCTVNAGTFYTVQKPKRKGYTFVGWFINNKNVTNGWTVQKDCTVIAKWSKINLKKTKITKIKNKQITFKKVASADGYQIQYSSSKKFKSKYTINTKKTNAKLKKLKKGMYIRVRVYKKDSAGKSVYGKWYTKRYK